MGVNTARVLAKLAKLPLDASTRKRLVSSIVKSKKKHKATITVYSWDIRNNVAREIFLSKKETLISWCVQHNIWKKSKATPGVVVYSWEIPVKEIFKYTSSRKITGVPVTRKTLKTDVSSIPAEIHKDIQQTLES